MTLTVANLCKRYSVSAHTILRWIASGELRAIDVSRKAGGRPSWRITQESLSAFEALRSPTPVPPVKRRRKQMDSVIAFY